MQINPMVQNFFMLFFEREREEMYFIFVTSSERRRRLTQIVNVAVLSAVVVAIASWARPLRADDQLLIAKHRAAGLNCAQCHEEKPPARTPSIRVCTGCHGDQQALARKTENASPNPHAPPHAAPGETQACTECHHVHRPSEVTCTSCHRDFFFNVK